MYKKYLKKSATNNNTATSNHQRHSKTGTPSIYRGSLHIVCVKAATVALVYENKSKMSNKHMSNSDRF